MTAGGYQKPQKPMPTLQTPSPYTYADRLFLRWMEQTDWSPNTKRVCRALFAHQRKHEQVYLLHSTIAAWLGISVATVKRAIRFLVSLGLLQVTSQFRKDGGQASNRYKVLPHILAEAVPDQTTSPASRASGNTTTPTPPLHVDHKTPLPSLTTTLPRNAENPAPHSPQDPEGAPLSVLESSFPRTPSHGNPLESSPTERKTSTDVLPPSQPSSGTSSLGDVLAAWAHQHAAFSPTMTPGDVHADPGGRISSTAPSPAPATLTGSAPVAKGKISLDQKINNRALYPDTDAPKDPNQSGTHFSVVVSSHNSSKSLNTAAPCPQAPSSPLEQVPQGEQNLTPVSPWMQNLLRVGSKETIERVMGWYRACPPHHPARPQHPAAWIYTAVKQNWQTPPTWMAQKPSAPVRYQIVTEEQAHHAADDHPRVTEDHEWATIQEWLALGTPATQDFLSHVEQTLRQRLGGAFAHQALASRGPLWQALCRELWRQQDRASASA